MACFIYMHIKYIGKYLFVNIFASTDIEEKVGLGNDFIFWTENYDEIITIND